LIEDAAMDTSVRGSRYPIGAPHEAQSSTTGRPSTHAGKARKRGLEDQVRGREAVGSMSLERSQVSHEQSTSSHGTPSA